MSIVLKIENYSCFQVEIGYFFVPNFMNPLIFIL